MIVVERALFRRSATVPDLAREVEAVEVRADQAERLAELGRVVSAVAHEVRNPLAIFGPRMRTGSELERGYVETGVIPAPSWRIRMEVASRIASRVPHPPTMLMLVVKARLNAGLVVDPAVVLTRIAKCSPSPNQKLKLPRWFGSSS